MNKETLGESGLREEQGLSIGERYKSEESTLGEIEKKIEETKGQIGQKQEDLPEEIFKAQQILKSAKEDAGSVNTQRILEAQRAIRSYEKEHPEFSIPMEKLQEKLRTQQQEYKRVLREVGKLISESVRPHVERGRSFIEIITELANLGDAGEPKRKAWEEVYRFLVSSQPLPQAKLVKRLEAERKKKDSVLQNLTEEEWQEFLANCTSLQLGLQVIARRREYRERRAAEERERKAPNILEIAKRVERFALPPSSRLNEPTLINLVREAYKAGFLKEVSQEGAQALIAERQQNQRKGPYPVIEVVETSFPAARGSETSRKTIYYTYLTPEPGSRRFIDKATEKVWEALLEAKRRCIERRKKKEQEDKKNK